MGEGGQEGDLRGKGGEFEEAGGVKVGGEGAYVGKGVWGLVWPCGGSERRGTASKPSRDPGLLATKESKPSLGRPRGPCLTHLEGLVPGPL